MATGVVGTASMLRARRRDVNVKPNRRLDRKSSRGMLYENEELRLRTININAEVERGQNDIKKLRRENEQLRREIWGLREEYDRLEELLHTAVSSHRCQEYSTNQHENPEELECRRNVVENEQNLQNVTCIKFQRSKSCSKVEFDNMDMVFEEIDSITGNDEGRLDEQIRTELCSKYSHIRNNLESIFPEVEYENTENNTQVNMSMNSSEIQAEEKNCPLSLEIPTMLEVHHNNIWRHSLYTMNTNSYALHKIHQHPIDVLSETDNVKDRKLLFTDLPTEIPYAREFDDNDKKPSSENANNMASISLNTNFIHVSYRNKEESICMTKQGNFVERNDFQTPKTSIVSNHTDSIPEQRKLLFSEGEDLDGLFSEEHENAGQQNFDNSAPNLQCDANQNLRNANSNCPLFSLNLPNELSSTEYSLKEANSQQLRVKDDHRQKQELSTRQRPTCSEVHETFNVKQIEDKTALHPDAADYSPGQNNSEVITVLDHEDSLHNAPLGPLLDTTARNSLPTTSKTSSVVDAQQRRLSLSLQNLSAGEGNKLFKKRLSFPPIKPSTFFGDYYGNLHNSNAIESSILQRVNLNNDQKNDQDVFTSNTSELKNILDSQQSVTHAYDPTSSEGNLQNCNNLHQPSSRCIKSNNLCESDDSVHEHIASGKTVQKQNRSRVFLENEINLSSPNISRQCEQNLSRTPNSVLQDEREGMKDSISCTERKNRSREQQENEKSSPDEMYRYMEAFSKENRKCSGNGSHFQSLHKMSVIVGDTQHGRSLFVDHSLSASSWENSLANEHCIKQISMCSNSQRKFGFCARRNILVKDNGEKSAGTAVTSTSPSSADTNNVPIAEAEAVRLGTIMWERTNSYGSMTSNVDGRFSVTKMKPSPDFGHTRQRSCDENVPWCGCWGNGCI